MYSAASSAQSTFVLTTCFGPTAPTVAAFLIGTTLVIFSLSDGSAAASAVATRGATSFGPAISTLTMDGATNLTAFAPGVISSSWSANCTPHASKSQADANDKAASPMNSHVLLSIIEPGPTTKSSLDRT